jgi:hypothetical protein
MPSITVLNLNAGANLPVPSDINGTFSASFVAPHKDEEMTAPSNINENYSEALGEPNEDELRVSMGTTSAGTIVFTFSRTDVTGQADVIYNKASAMSGAFTITVDTRLQLNATYDLTPTLKNASGNTVYTGAAIRGLKTVAAPVVNTDPNSN